MSLNLNKYIGCGRVSWKGELKTIPSGKTILNFQVAINEGTTSADGKASTEFVSCVAWEKTAEFISKWFEKGTPIYFEGRLKTTKYNKQNVDVNVTNVYISYVSFVVDKPKSNTQTDGQNAETPKNSGIYEHEDAPAPQIQTAFEPDELPF